MSELREALRDLREAEDFASKAAKLSYQARFDFTSEQAHNFARWLSDKEASPRILSLLESSQDTTVFKREFHRFMETPKHLGGNKRSSSKIWRRSLCTYKPSREARINRQANEAKAIGLSQLRDQTAQLHRSIWHSLGSAKQDHQKDDEWYARQALRNQQHKEEAHHKWELSDEFAKQRRC